MLVVFDPPRSAIEDLLKVFWEAHDPTQGMRQGNDVGTQYRSAIYWTSPGPARAAQASRRPIERRSRPRAIGTITTEIAEAGPFYFAEAYHQQYLAKNPRGYCGIGGTGVCCPIGLAFRPDTLSCFACDWGLRWSGDMKRRALSQARRLLASRSGGCDARFGAAPHHARDRRRGDRRFTELVERWVGKAPGRFTFYYGRFPVPEVAHPR